MKKLSFSRAVVLALTVVSGLAACGGKRPPSGPAPSPGPAAVQIGTLDELQNGDRACYVVVTTDGGQQSIEGSFELCPGGGSDASALVGRRVTWTTEKSNVLAASCEGDMDCGKSDQVDLIVSITAAP